MRLNILAFAAGVLLLQWQAALPAWGSWGLLATGLLLIPALRRSFLMVLVCLLLGFSFASWRAEIRLADELPSALEGQDIELIGVVASLPQDFSHGTRFEFTVETPLTVTNGIPQRIMLSWYQGRADAPSEKRVIKPGERWQMTVRLKRPHGNANPHGFDYEAWLF